VLFIAPAGLADASSPTAALVTARTRRSSAADLPAKRSRQRLNDLAYFATRHGSVHTAQFFRRKYLELPFPRWPQPSRRTASMRPYIVEPFYAVNESTLTSARASEAVSMK